MTQGRRLLTLLALTAVIIAAIGSQAAGAVTPKGEPAAKRKAAQITRIVKSVKKRYPVRAVIYGVWVKGRPLATGALGQARPGVRVTTRHHFRIGNVTESFLATLLLQLVDQGRVSLEDPVSNWHPNLPNADTVTLGMLATMTSGYNDFVTTLAFQEAYAADPYRHFQVQELLDYAFSQPEVFPPGQGWKFSDTNFVLLGDILSKITGRPLPQLLREQILTKIRLRNSRMRDDGRVPRPALHGYDPARGKWEDTTPWNMSWITNAGTMTSTLADMGRWARVLGTGSLLSRGSHRLQILPQPSGLGLIPPGRYYGMGTANTGGWVYNAPHMPGYFGVVSYLPSKKIAVVVFVTQKRGANPGLSFSSTMYNRIGKLLAPKQPPYLAPCSRPPC